MEDIIIEIGGTEYRCSPFHLSMQNLTGVDVYLNETYWNGANSSYLGEILDISLPDEDDANSLQYFTDEVEDWLSGK